MTEELETRIQATVLRLRVLVGALIGGVLVFGAIVVLVADGRDSSVAGSGGSVFTILLPAFALACLTAFGVVSWIQGGRLRAGRASDPELLAAFSNRTIVGAALAESFALLSGVAYLLEGNDWKLLGIAGAVLVMAGFLPSERKVHNFLAAARDRSSPS